MIIIGNGRTITRDEETPYLENGAVCVSGNIIKEVGSLPDIMKKYPEAEFVDAGGGVIMPGFINTHHHIYSAMARGLSIPGHHPGGFLEILEGMWWRIDRKLTLPQISLSAYATYLDCIKNGVTTVFDHHASYGAIKGSLSAISEAASRLGVRTCLCFEISDRDGHQKMREAAKENLEFLEYAEKSGGDMQKAMIGLHASFTLSDSTLDYIESRRPQGAGYHIHAAEGREDVENCYDLYKKPVIERLQERNILGNKTFAVHCVHINEQEMEILRETDTIVVHNPQSNMGNAVGCPRVLDIFKKGILIGLGTDGYTSDMTESLKTANVLYKHETGDPNAAWVEIPQMLYAHNREIAGRFFETPVGILKPGAAADIIVADYSPLTPMTARNYDSHILFGMNGRSVVTTMIDGELLMKDRELIKADEEKILGLTREEAAKLWASL